MQPKKGQIWICDQTILGGFTWFNAEFGHSCRVVAANGMNVHIRWIGLKSPNITISRLDWNKYFRLPESSNVEFILQQYEV